MQSIKHLSFGMLLQLIYARLMIAENLGLYEILQSLQAKSLARGNKAEDEDAASTSSSFANVAMNGSEVFKFAVRAVPSVSCQGFLPGLLVI